MFARAAHRRGPGWHRSPCQRLAEGCLDVALEHHRAIVLLISHALYGSAFALIRLLFEAYMMRGLWLHRCASEAALAPSVNYLM